MTVEMNQMGQANADTRDMKAKLLQLAELGTKSPTPGQLTRIGRKARVIAELHKHGTLSAASVASGVSRATIYRWRDEDKAFAAEVDEWVQETMEDELVNSLFRIATSDDPKMANAAVRAGELLLKANKPEKYGDRLKIDQTTNQQVTIVHEVRDAYRARQTAALAALKASAVDVVAVPAGE